MGMWSSYSCSASVCGITQSSPEVSADDEERGLSACDALEVPVVLPLFSTCIWEQTLEHISTLCRMMHCVLCVTTDTHTHKQIQKQFGGHAFVTRVCSYVDSLALCIFECRIVLAIIVFWGKLLGSDIENTIS